MKRILIVEDDPNIATALEVRFRACGYQVVIANDVVQAVRLAVNTQLDLIVLDISLPAGNGLTLAEKFQSAEATRGVPIILITASSDPKLRQRAMELKAAGFFEKPYDVEELIPVVKDALHLQPDREDGQSGAQRTHRMDSSEFPKKILIVEDDARIATALGLRLKAAGYKTELAFDAVIGVQSAVRHLPDLMLLDVSMPAGDGFAVAERVQKVLPEPPPIIFLTAGRRPDFLQRARDLGAAAYFEKPYEVEELVDAVGKILNPQSLSA